MGGFSRRTALALLLIIGLFTLRAQADAVKLTEEQAAFIAQHPVIRLGVDPKFIPYEFFDSDGVYKGIAADYIALIEERTGLNFEVAEGLTWTEAYESAARGELDALPCISKTSERERFFLFSEPYYTFQRVIFVKSDDTSIKGLTNLSGKSVAVQKNSSHHSYMLQFFDVKLSLYDTVEEALLAVSNDREEAYIGNLATAVYLAKQSGITNLKYISLDSDQKQTLHFAVSKDMPILIEIINAALEDITVEERMAINNRWIVTESHTDLSRILRIIAVISLVIGLILLVSLYWILKLKAEIKARKKLEGELIVAREAAERANSVKSAFLARMSHEIRTPLNAITGMSYILKKTELLPAQKRYLDRILSASRDMLAIINDILDFSKIESGKIELERVSFSLDSLLKDVLNIISFKAEEQNVNLTLQVDPAMPDRYFGDPKRIRQILLNLASNAVKFTNDGVVSISVSRRSHEGDMHELEMKVKDSGIGMTDEQMKNLFVPFTQADASIERRFGGTGLGLSIVKGFVDLMGGAVAVESTPGEGSTFTIIIKLEADPAVEERARESAIASCFKGLRAIALESSNLHSDLLRSYLKSFGIEADISGEEASALRMMQEALKAGGKAYDIVIIDDESAAGGGLNFAVKARSLDWGTAPPKTLLILPMSNEALLDKLDQSGIDFGITKPIIPSVLFNTLAEMFKKDILDFHAGADNQGPEEIKLERPYRILVVEDNKTNQFIAKSMLEQYGFEVMLADDGKAGYDKYLSEQSVIDAVLMDLHMPVMNGYDSAALIRKADPTVPIIAMTADAITGVEEKCRQSGMEAYISKPFEPEIFIRTILEQIRRRQSSSFSERQMLNSDSTPAQSHDAAELVLDKEAGLKMVGGNPQIFTLILGEFLKENALLESDINSAIESGNYAQATQLVHKVKGSSGSIGAKALYNTAVSFQKALKEADKPAIATLHAQFVRRLVKLLAAIKEELESK